jgi:soluble lytic murein transglycosylase-like protein
MKLELCVLQRAGVAIAVASYLCVSLAGQGNALSQVTTNEPFGAVDAALARAAEAQLSSFSAPVMVRSNLKVVQQTGGTPAANTDLRALPWSGVGLGSASARVGLLRPVIEPILASHGVPAGMAAAVMMVESGGRSDALSSKGARGFWQLMPDTARRYGLRVDGALDERLDLVKATTAAAQYLHDLYAHFGDWRLALAGYNAGESNISIAIIKAHTQDFGRLSDLRMLPLETREYVPKVLGRVGFMTTSKENRRPTGATVFAFNNP